MRTDQETMEFLTIGAKKVFRKFLVFNENQSKKDYIQKWRRQNPQQKRYVRIINKKIVIIHKLDYRNKLKKIALEV